MKFSNDGVEQAIIDRAHSEESDFRISNLNILVEKMLSDGNVLDYGCGIGTSSLYLLERAYEVSCLDISEELIRLTRERLKVHAFPDVECFTCVDQLLFKFDNIVMLDVLEHIENDIQEIRRLKGLLVDGGRLIICVPAFMFLYSGRDVRIGHYRRYTVPSLVKKLEDEGFVVVRKRYWNAVLFPVLWLITRFNKGGYSEKLRNQSGWKNKVLSWWFRNVENRWDFGFGLSVIVVAEKKHEVRL